MILIPLHPASFGHIVGKQQQGWYGYKIPEALCKLPVWIILLALLQRTQREDKRRAFSSYCLDIYKTSLFHNLLLPRFQKVSTFSQLKKYYSRNFSL
ncbi:hypothetical protein AVEN_10430-1 [Araneus ventricosus]|uniref:Uncharacterized protein n=1 Tax=Araneus ventricosus TaxID=182803 RepID=A0A4Y2MVU5_ARAVE|nr:hypothetical protein AVEN_216054-1 [Araneus ventricosus]GBN29766.1 hypothetical protein AVEN_10430-1 [Araneus ventricosus]